MSVENKFITQTLPGFPVEMEWASLRALGIEHLGSLAGRVWTDHNVHDPGITILETLCYAITDLAYRTNLPASDIFSKDPSDTSKEDNFFSPAEILTCNPVTIIDFRKMLIDIEGVRNAWLKDSFYDCNNEGIKAGETTETGCSSCYNGLYRVYVELEEDHAVGSKAYLEVLGRIRSALMAHRNICEDFIDIRILCHKKIGLCADIELDSGADVEMVYSTLLQNLADYFTPRPKFYTLRQLLEGKKKSIEDIFAGRPYNIRESHGFVDTGELESLPLRKEVHLSDVYSVILGVQGVRNIHDLGWVKDCGGNKPVIDRQWKWNIPENNIPVFSPECSGFRFSVNGRPVALDQESIHAIALLGANGKVLYKMPSPYLDPEKPAGVFRDDLGEYISIQKEFPRVYGIEEGGLPSDASDRRKAQALQLKGYLLFFDQLLANYVAQLKNIRSLYAINSPAAKDQRRTYFMNRLAEVPEVEKLLRFSINESTGMYETLAIPVQLKPLEDAISDESIKAKGLEACTIPITYATLHLCDTALNNLYQDLVHGSQAIKLHSSGERCWFFYFYTSLDDTVLLGSKVYSTEMQARQAADLIKYAATYRENFRTYSSQDRFSFSLEFRLKSYGQYLQRILEDENLYNERRQGFLDHLLSRFAETFTDYALLSFGSADSSKLASKEISQKERFLVNYGDISSNRGRGYNYSLNVWGNNNLSGFEKRVAALAGMGDLKKGSLCNFVVEPLEQYYRVRIMFGDEEILTGSGKYENLDSALEAAKDFFVAARERNNYEVKDCLTPPYHIHIKLKDRGHFRFMVNYKNRKQASGAIDYLFTFFTDYPPAHAIYRNIGDEVQFSDEHGMGGEIVGKERLSGEQEGQQLLKDPAGYRFFYFLGFDRSTGHFFHSADEYPTREAAASAAKLFYKNSISHQLSEAGDRLALQWKQEEHNIVCVSSINSRDEVSRKKCEELLLFRKLILEAAEGTLQDYIRFLHINVPAGSNTLVYRLVDKDNPCAMYLGEAGSKTAAEADIIRSKLYFAPWYHDYTRVSLSENIVREYTDERNRKWFHYTLVIENTLDGRPPGLVILESVKGYTSRELAYTAFRDQLPRILKKAMFPENYGAGRYISLEKIVDHSATGESGQAEAVVYIPELTIESFSWSGAIAMENIIKIAKRYPVRYATREENEFYEIFPCEKDERIQKDREQCRKLEEGKRWYYFTLSSADAKEEWKGMKYFATETEAFKDFYFFLLLLKYPGNYSVHRDYCACKQHDDGDCECTWRVFLREVLLESKLRYAGIEEAWKGVEEFVCVSQTEGAFQSYLSVDRTGYSFDVSRMKGSLIHPYRYDTRQKRDNAMEELFGWFGNSKWNFPSVVQQPGGDWILQDTDASKIASIKPLDPGKPFCDFFLHHLPQWIKKGEWRTTETGHELVYENEKVMWLDQPSFPIDEWKNRINRALCYYPIEKIDGGRDQNGNPRYKYVVRIQLPGYGRCEAPVSDPCDNASPVNCHSMAWKSDCCFDSCVDALSYLQQLVESLSDKGNYRPFFDCECGPFGISLLSTFDDETIIPCPPPRSGDKRDKRYQQAARRFLPRFCSMKILAFNPQSYATPGLDCEAIERAKALLNTEGFHLVEHILLRPRCDEDCNDQGRPVCPVRDPRDTCVTELSKCNDWEWKTSDDPDPCLDKQKAVVFRPAGDPYSFIATVVLPAWPERFRKQENRQIIENMLYREAPAHILLRILWLKPGDLCAFEKLYRNWQRYLGGSYKDKCTDKNATCELIQFLFRSSLMSADLDCEDCDPCSETETKVDPCTKPVMKDCVDRSVQGNIAELFCWKPQLPPLENQDTKEPHPEAIPVKGRSHWLSARREAYHELLAKYIPDHADALRGTMAAYLSAPDTDTKKMEKLIDLIVRKNKQLNAKQRSELVSLLVRSHLDKISFESDTSHIDKLRSLLHGINKSGIETKSIYKTWYDPAIEKLSPEISLKNIKEILTGKPV